MNNRKLALTVVATLFLLIPVIGQVKKISGTDFRRARMGGNEKARANPHRITIVNEITLKDGSSTRIERTVEYDKAGNSRWNRVEESNGKRAITETILLKGKTFCRISRGEWTLAKGPCFNPRETGASKMLNEQATVESSRSDTNSVKIYKMVRHFVMSHPEMGPENVQIKRTDEFWLDSKGRLIRDLSVLELTENDLVWDKSETKYEYGVEIPKIEAPIP
jgi:hypothetical protein